MGWVYKDGSGLFTNYKNEETGEESVKLHTPKVVWKSCKQGTCSFEIVGSRELRCLKCGKSVEFVPGRDNEFLKANNIN